MFYGTGKKKGFANGSWRCWLLRPALRQRGALGVACPHHPCSWHTQGLQCLRPSALPIPDPRVLAWEPPGCDLGTEFGPRSTEGN